MKKNDVEKGVIYLSKNGKVARQVTNLGDFLMCPGVEDHDGVEFREWHLNKSGILAVRRTQYSGDGRRSAHHFNISRKALARWAGRPAGAEIIGQLRQIRGDGAVE